MKPAREKRKHRRFKVTIPVDCSGVHFFQTRDSQNISSGGVFIATDLAEKTGTKVEINFLFKEGWEEFSLLGEVVWSGRRSQVKPGKEPSFGMGIKFINPPSQFIKKIQQ